MNQIIPVSLLYILLLVSSCGQKSGALRMDKEQKEKIETSPSLGESKENNRLNKKIVTDFPTQQKVFLTEIDGTKKEFLIKKVDQKHSIMIMAKPCFPHKRYTAMLKSARFYTLVLEAYDQYGVLAKIAKSRPVNNKKGNMEVPVRTYYIDSNIEEPHWGDKVPIDYGHPLSRFFLISITGKPNAKIWLPKVGKRPRFMDNRFASFELPQFASKTYIDDEIHHFKLFALRTINLEKFEQEKVELISISAKELGQKVRT